MDKILIIEDDPDIAAIERDYLELSGCAVTICANGTDGQRAALEGAFDLILLDLMLPGTDGFSICRAVRAQKDIPILMVTTLGKDAEHGKLTMVSMHGVDGARRAAAEETQKALDALARFDGRADFFRDLIRGMATRSN